MQKLLVDRIRANPAHRALVADLDRHGLLSGFSDQPQEEIGGLTDEDISWPSLFVVSSRGSVVSTTS
jgi:hypothetical protein